MIDATPQNLFLALCLLALLYILRFLFLLLVSDCDIPTYSARISSRSFRGKVAWITGASSGIGEALAHHLAREGALLILSSRRTDALERVADALPCSRDNVAILPLDLSADDAVLENVAASVAEVHGRLDFLFNNAGVTQRSSVRELDMQHVRRMCDVNFLGQLAITRACLPALLESPGGQGTIVNTLSIAAIVKTPLRSTYCASKAAMAAYFTCLELEEPMLRVVNIYPGSVHTPICYSAMMKGGKTYDRMDPNIENGLDANRVADRMLAAVSSGLHRAWIARPKELNAVRLASAFPALWRRISFRLQDGYRKTIENAPQTPVESKDKDS